MNEEKTKQVHRKVFHRPWWKARVAKKFSKQEINVILQAISVWSNGNRKLNFGTFSTVIVIKTSEQSVTRIWKRRFESVIKSEGAMMVDRGKKNRGRKEKGPLGSHSKDEHDSGQQV